MKFYGSRTLPGIDDKGIVYVGGVGELTATLEAILLERKAPRPLVSVTVLLDLDKAYEPGDLVSLPSATSQTSKRARRLDTVRPTSSR